jgi:alpha-beta hydrolase superfamily lysophospholipase
MRKKILYSLLLVFIFLLVGVNYIAYNHSYNFTHYANISQNTLKVYDTSTISWTKKLGYILRGVEVPRPENKQQPLFSFITKKINTPKGNIEIWQNTHPQANGTVILFHGYNAKKSLLVERADEFYDFGYNVVLVDFLGSGGSDGNTVSIGYYEADQVKAVYDFVKGQGATSIYLFGISMGAVAIMKCMKDYEPEVKGIILECPFGYFKTTVKNRFKNFGIPSFPMADLLMLWGNYHTGYNTYQHNPARYALQIKCPVLLMHGDADHAVSKKEIDDIYNNLQGVKVLKTFEGTGHNIYNAKNWKAWQEAIYQFMVKTGGSPNPFYMENYSTF